MGKTRITQRIRHGSIAISVYLPIPTSLVLCAGLVSACGSSAEVEKSSPDATPTPDATLDLRSPTALSLHPQDGLAEVDPNTTISVVFDEPLSADSLTSQSFALRDWKGQPVAGTVEYDSESNTASIVPVHALSLLSSYSVTLSTEITDLAGNPLAENREWQFAIRDGNWQLGISAVVPVTADTSSAESPKVGSDAHGNGISTWIDNDGSSAEVWTNRFAADGSWDTPERISSGTITRIREIEIAVNKDGYAVVVWRQQDSGSSSLWATQYIPGAGWTAAEILATNAYDIGIEIDGQGNALLVWSDNSGALLFNTLQSSGGWQSTRELVPASQQPYYPRISINDGGNAAATWIQSGSGGGVHSALFDAVTETWGPRQLISSSPGQPRSSAVSITPNGDAIVVWSNLYNTDIDLRGAHFAVDSGWTGEELLESIGGDVFGSPQLETDSLGNTALLWLHKEGQINLYAKRFDGSTWSSEQLVEDSMDEVESFRFDLDSRGNALAVWQVSTGNAPILYSNRYRVQSGWDLARPLATKEASFRAAAPTSGQLDVAVSVGADSGTGLALWIQKNSNMADDNLYPYSTSFE